MLRYQVTRKARREFPLLLITKDKYQTCYFHVATHEDLYQACFRILQERLDLRWYGDPDEAAGAPAKIEKLQKEADELSAAIDAGIPVSLLPDAKRRYQNLKREITDINHATAFYGRVIEVLKTSNSGEDALDLLMDRADHEYEWIALETYTKP